MVVSTDDMSDCGAVSDVECLEHETRHILFMHNTIVKNVLYFIKFLFFIVGMEEMHIDKHIFICYNTSFYNKYFFFT